MIGFWRCHNLMKEQGILVEMKINRVPPILFFSKSIYVHV